MQKNRKNTGNKNLQKNSKTTSYRYNNIKLHNFTKNRNKKQNREFNKKKIVSNPKKIKKGIEIKNLYFLTVILTDFAALL